jgi:hypothetical protein
MISEAEARDETEFHEDHKIDAKRPRVWRRNATHTKFWKSRPGEFRLPVKYGLYKYGAITDKGLIVTGFPTIQVHSVLNCPTVARDAVADFLASDDGDGVFEKGRDEHLITILGGEYAPDGVFVFRTRYSDDAGTFVDGGPNYGWARRCEPSAGYETGWIVGFYNEDDVVPGAYFA